MPDLTPPPTAARPCGRGACGTPRASLIGLAPYFVVMIIVYIIDLFVLVPLTVWSIQAAVATCKGGAATEKPAAPGATVVAKAQPSGRAASDSVVQGGPMGANAPVGRTAI